MSTAVALIRVALGPMNDLRIRAVNRFGGGNAAALVLIILGAAHSMLMISKSKTIE